MSRSYASEEIRIPPRTDNNKTRMQTEAPLPRLALERPSSSPLRWDELTLEDVQALTSQWGMPLVVTPGDGDAAAMAPVFWMTGAPAESAVRSGDVGRLYGPHCLLLDWFAPEVRGWAERHAPSEVWKGRDPRRTGFRLCGLLDAIVRQAGERESLAVGDLAEVAADLLVSRVDGRCQLEFRIRSVVPKDSAK